MPQLIDEVQLYTDGGCRGNPGPGAIGMIIMDADHHELFAWAERTDYRALIKGLDLCAAYTRERVVCYSDRELLINQMTGAYRVKNEELRALWQRAKDLGWGFKRWYISMFAARISSSRRRTDF